MGNDWPRLVNLNSDAKESHAKKGSLLFKEDGTARKGVNHALDVFRTPDQREAVYSKSLKASQKNINNAVGMDAKMKAMDSHFGTFKDQFKAVDRKYL